MVASKQELKKLNEICILMLSEVILHITFYTLHSSLATELN